MTEYRFARPGEEEAILDHINLVFSQAHQPHHFDRLIPKVYAHSDHAPLHAIALEEGKIRGAVGLLPMMLQLDEGHALKLGFVGSVSVHERYRGRGYMKKLMEMILDSARRQGMDFLALSGQRQRYGYWGFENGGTCLRFDINKKNIRHALSHISAEGMEISIVEKADDPRLEEMDALCRQQKMICCRRRDRFLEIMQNWNHHLYAFEKDGKFLGYACGNGEWIGEMALLDEGELLPVIKAWLQKNDHLHLEIPAFMADRARLIKQFAEGYSIRDGEMYRILNWKKVLAACLEMKHGCTPLQDGAFVFEIEGEGRFRLALEDGKARVTETQEDAEKIFTPGSAVEFFFSPFSVYFSEKQLFSNWLPLHLNIPSIDAF